MKKFLSLLLAVVMVIGMLPAGAIFASAAEVSETITFDANRTQRTSFSTTQQVWTSGDVTFTNDKASSTSNVADYSNPVRLYAKSSITFAYTGATISKIVITCGSSTYATALKNSVGDEASASNADVTITPSAESNSYTIASLTAQVRIKSLVVYGNTVDTGACTHTNTITVEAVEPTCTTAGSTAGVYCNDCFTYTEGHEDIAALGHTETSEVTAPTCTAEGYTTYTCSVCANVRTGDTVAATGHNMVDNTCTVCGVEQLVLEKASSISVGGKVIFVCEAKVVELSSFNGTSYANGTAYTDAPVGLYVWTVAAGASEGTYAFVNEDGAYLAWTSGNSAKTSDTLDANSSWTVTFDESGNAVVANAADATRKLQWNASSPRFACYTTAQTAIQIYAVPCDHAYTGVVTAPTCEVAGFTTYTCSACGDSYVADEVAALGHNYVNGVCTNCNEADPNACAHENKTTTTVDATCTVVGSVTVTCDACGEVISTEEIAALGHTEVVDAAVAATCTATGLTEGSHCSVCNEVIVAQTETAALGHSYADGVCSVCGEADPSMASYELMTPDTVRAGNYVIGAIRSSTVTYPAVYPATGAVSSGDIVVASTSVNATDDVLTGDQLTGAQVFVLTGDNTNGFTIGYNNGTEMVYLGYTSVANRKLAFSASYSNILWKIESFGSGVMLTDGKINVFENSTGTGAIRGYTTTYSSARGIYLFREVVANECIHTVDTWTTETAPTCTATGTQTGACTLCGEIQTSAIPATGHTYAYSESAIICANGCDYSAAYTLSTIADAKAYTDASVVYYVKGVVTYVSAEKVYIEDTTGGIMVQFTSAEVAAGIALGDEILVWDCLTTWNGLIETTYTTADEYLKVSSGNALPSQTVTIADLKADTTNEYLAERVVIENVTVGTINTSGNTALTDADGNSINIYKVSGLSEEINENDTVTVTAIVSTYNGYQLLINPGTAATDVVETAAGEEEVVETVTIAEAKVGTAGEYYQVEGTVTYVSGRNVYIQDATGGIVVYLAANAATTQVGDNIKAYGALKIYNGLIELDAVDETNADFYTILSSGNTVEAQKVTIADLLADTTNEYLAEKVTLSDVYVSHYSYNGTYKNVTYNLVDANGNEIQIYRVSVASEEECIAGGSIVNVEAIVSAYVSEETVGNGYQLVTNNDKIVVTGTCAHETTELVNYKAATCSVAGYTGDTMCTVCQNYTVRGEEIAVVDHNYVNGICSFGCGNTQANVAVCGSDGETNYPNLFAALAMCGEGKYVKLLADIDLDTYVAGEEEFVLNNNLYIDMNGFDLKGTLNTDGYTVYAMDSTTNEYTCEDVGVFSCVEGESAIVPVFDWSTTEELTGAVTRYVALSGETGYTFHRIFLGITHVSIKTANTGIGYKAVFCADEMVQAQLGGHGYTLQLGDFAATAKTVAISSFANKESVALRVNNYDIKNFGEMDLKASVYMTIGGVTITSAEVSYSMRDMLELAAATELSASQIQALQNMILPYIDVMDGWAIDSLRPSEEV